MERSAKAIQMTFTAKATKTHDIRTIIKSLPVTASVKSQLLAAWNNLATRIIKNYSSMMYINTKGDINSWKIKLIFVFMSSNMKPSGTTPKML